MTTKDKNTQEHLKTIGEKYGFETVKEAAAEVAKYDPPTDRWNLTDQARKLCWGLLGPPLESPEYASFEEQRKRWAEESPAENHAQEQKKRKRTGRQCG
jgi:hypothetical protein